MWYLFRTLLHSWINTQHHNKYDGQCRLYWLGMFQSMPVQVILGGGLIVRWWVQIEKSHRLLTTWFGDGCWYFIYFAVIPTHMGIWLSYYLCTKYQNIDVKNYHSSIHQCLDWILFGPNYLLCKNLCRRHTRNKLDLLIQPWMQYILSSVTWLYWNTFLQYSVKHEINAQLAPSMIPPEVDSSLFL